MKDDYDLSELEQIAVRDFKYNIMPRYRYHYVDNDYEKFSLDLVDRLVSEGSSVIDIGAHYGIYSLLSAKKAGSVYAFEPVPENQEILQKNIADNGFSNIKPINKAVSDSEGEVTFNIPWASDSAGFYDHPNAKSIRKVKVQTAKIDSELPRLENLSFVKIDTEGHELHVLEGMKETLKRNKRAKLLVEFNPECLSRAGSKPYDLINKLVSLNYDIFAVHEDTRQMVRVDEKTSLSAILKGKTYLNFLCLRRGTWLNTVLSSHSSSIGGAELRLYEIVGMLLAQKEVFVLPYVILPADGPLKDRFEKLPIALEVIHMQGWVGHKGLDLDERQQVNALNAEAEIRLGQLFCEFRPQIALTNSITIPWTAVVAKAVGVPHVWSINEFGNLDHGLSFDYGFVPSASLINEYSLAVFVNSKAVYEHFRPYIIPVSKLKMIYQGVGAPQLQRAPANTIYTSQAEFKIVVSGRVIPSKGQLTVVQALNELRNKGIKAELILLGDNSTKEYVDQINEFTKKNNIEKFVHMIGHKDSPQDYVELADIFVMPSRKEAYGRVTLEAMYLGKPIIGTKSGGTSEIIEPGVSGVLFEPDDWKGLAKELEKLAKDPELLSKMSEAAKVRAQKFSFENDIFISEFLSLQKVKVVNAPMARDLLQGSAYLLNKQHSETIAINEKHQKELADFSNEYNKVYEAYRKLEERISSQQEVIENLSRPRTMKEKLSRRLKKGKGS